MAPLGGSTLEIVLMHVLPGAAAVAREAVEVIWVCVSSDDEPENIEDMEEEDFCGSLPGEEEDAPELDLFSVSPEELSVMRIGDF